MGYNAAMSEQRIEKIELAKDPKVSVIIPHFYSKRDENFEGLLNDIRQQSFKELEIIIIHSVSPQGKAINMGVRESRGEILVTIDDDSRLPHPDIIQNVVDVLRKDASIGMAGASVVIPPNANWFQRSASKQFPRYHMPVVKEVLDSDLPGHPCAGFPRKVFLEIGMERENILRGLDPDLRVRIRKAGYRVVLVPDTWIYHPLPESISKFIWTFFRNGYGSAYIQLVHPEINYDTDESADDKTFVAKRPFIYRIVRYPFRLLHSLVTLQWIRLFGYTVYVFGYLAGYIRFALFQYSPIQPSSSKTGL